MMQQQPRLKIQKKQEIPRINLQGLRKRNLNREVLLKNYLNAMNSRATSSPRNIQQIVPKNAVSYTNKNGSINGELIPRANRRKVFKPVVMKTPPEFQGTLTN